MQKRLFKTHFRRIAALLAAPLALSGVLAYASPAPAHENGGTAHDHTVRTAQAAPPIGRPTMPHQGTQPSLPDSDELNALIKKGATMEEIARVRDPIATTPEAAVRALRAGNMRFFGGSSMRPDLSVNERRAQIITQTPFAVILGCSDSRVPTELVFDQTPGSLFVVRVAGNVVEPATAGSVEYAVAHLKSHTVVVMGHEGCGAVHAATLNPEQLRGEPRNVQYLVDHITPAVRDLPAIRDPKARMREAVIANVRLQVHRMRQNPVVAAAVRNGQINVIGAYYEIGSGAVDFLDTDEELRLSPQELQQELRAAPGARRTPVLR